jgi:hypothetical protein
VFEEHQCVEAVEPDGVDVQEIAGDDGVGVGGEELPPGRSVAAWCWVDAGGVEVVQTVEAAIG